MDKPEGASQHASGPNTSLYAPKTIRNPFDTPPIQSRPGTIGSFAEFSYNASESPRPLRQRKFKSARLIGSYDKPWTLKRDRRMLLDKLFFWGLAFIGLGIGAYLVYSGWASIDNPPYCLIFEDDFSNGISADNWNYEIQVGDYGTGSFDWTTNDKNNVYTDEKGLHIVPTITSEATDITPAQILNGYTLNLTSQGICTGIGETACVVKSNSTAGTIINPVRSARLTTQGKHNITYGKVEVVAKLPRGDWLWPAIWMMPESNVYGAWPASGEIDIMESKGNDGATYTGGGNVVGGTLHWAPDGASDAYWRTNGVRYMSRGDYSDAFHTYAVEWSESYIYTWVDTRLVQSLYVSFGRKYGNMYQRGDFAETTVNGSVLPNPWSVTGRYNTPFDEAFYLILNVAVGATNGYFQDGYGNKPWVDDSASAPKQFLDAQSVWEGTWGEGDTRGMTVQSVKLFSRNACDL